MFANLINRHSVKAKIYYLLKIMIQFGQNSYTRTFFLLPWKCFKICDTDDLIPWPHTVTPAQNNRSFDFALIFFMPYLLPWQQ